MEDVTHDSQPRKMEKGVEQDLQVELSKSVKSPPIVTSQSNKTYLIRKQENMELKGFFFGGINEWFVTTLK